jgi:DNA repair photolyase
MGDLRWRQRQEGDPVLFESNRVVGRGEYRGLEFLEVESKRIINEVPTSSRMPFRWTINAYRGCSHACVYCLAGETPVLLGDGRTKPISAVRPGDVVYGTTRRGQYLRYVPTLVLDHWSTVKAAYRIVLEDGTELIASGDHRFLTERGWKHVTGGGQGRACRPHLTPGDSLIGLEGSTTPETTNNGEGFLSTPMPDDGDLAIGRRSGSQRIGLKGRPRFLPTTDDATSRKQIAESAGPASPGALWVTEIKPLGFEMPMFDITTGTGDFIANGVVSHNCFARPTHRYLDLDPGRDFESKIVVKTNAVELARAETAPHRWRGDPIAMGTNTDPYQAAEGKYRLTRGIIEVLSERANPFSILTKSPLVLRDLDVLVDAAAGADVKVDFSIGTLDESVWKATEPGTPHPRKRVDAVAKLTAAGIRSGVLVAPILPGLSDDPEQVRQVVSACVEAGASYVTPILLHLRPGVRELYMEWLEQERPDLVPVHQAMYGRAYPPQADRDRLTATVVDLVRQAGGIERWRPRPTRPKAWRPEQLRLL